MQYLWQYYLLIAVVFVQGLFLLRWVKSGKWIFAFLCFVELAFIAGFRDWSIGNDTRNYVNTFILSMDYPQLLKSHMEIGYLWFNRFLATFTTTPQMLLITTSVFIIGVWVRFFYKYSVSFLISILLFVVLDYSATLTMIRQEIAMCMILLAIPFVIKRQFLLFLAVIMLAVSVHSSSILAIGLYFIYPFPFKIRHVSWVLIASIVVFIFLAPLLNKVISITGRYESYMGNILMGEETKLASIVKFAIQAMNVSFLLFSYKFVLPKNREFSSPLPLPFLLWCSVVAFCLQFIAIRGTVLERLVSYFGMFNYISIPYFARCYPHKIRFLVVSGLLFCFILYKSIVFVYRPEWNYVLPFEFCF